MVSAFEIETQERLNWCWAAVAASVSRYFFPDRALPQKEIARQVLGAVPCTDPASPACDQPAALDQALDAVNTLLGKSLKNPTLHGKFLTFDAIRKQIDSSRPICARIQWIGEERSHFVMISGYSVSQSGERWVDVQDPYYEDSVVRYEHFVSAYLGAGKWCETYLVGQP